MAIKQCRDKSNILVVDDDVGILEILEKILADQGYKVLTAQDGLDALKVAKKSNIKLALLDIKMPKMDGIELLDQFKKGDPDLIVIMMTAACTLNTSVTAMKLGAYDYITKPFDVNFVISLVEQALAQQRTPPKTW